MKKFIISAFALAIVLLGSNKVVAQKGFSFSVKGIPQFSFLENSDDNNNNAFDRKADFDAGFGLGAEYGFTKKMGVGFDVLYSFQGQRYKLDGFEYNQRLDYVKVPVYFINRIPLSSKISLVGKIGPQISFRTSSKLTDKDGNTIISNTNSQYESVTFGAAALGGAEYKLISRIWLTAAIRGDYDFTNAEDDSYSKYQTGRAKTYNLTTGLEIGLRYILK